MKILNPIRRFLNRDVSPDWAIAADFGEGMVLYRCTSEEICNDILQLKGHRIYHLLPKVVHRPLNGRKPFEDFDN